MAMFETSVTVAGTVEQVFEFLRHPQNLSKISHPDVGLSFVDAPDMIELGSRLEFKVQGFGMVQQIVHEIVDFRPPTGFTEKQVKGPLKLWIHQHAITGVDGNQVTIADSIQFEAPGGLVGLMITEDRILDSLENGFDYQSRQLKKHFGDPV